MKPQSLFETIDYQSIPVEDSYQGPRWDDEEDHVSESFCHELMEYLRNQGRLHKKYLIKLLVYAKRYFGKYAVLCVYNVYEEETYRSIGQYRLLSSEREWNYSLWGYTWTVL